MGGGAELPGMTAEAERYFRDVYDHLIRISDLIDTYRDLLTSAMDVYLSTVSNRLNTVMKQLAVIATIFLPLTFITGFFGQNFGWLVRPHRRLARVRRARRRHRDRRRRDPGDLLQAPRLVLDTRRPRHIRFVPARFTAAVGDANILLILIGKNYYGSVEVGQSIGVVAFSLMLVVAAFESRRERGTVFSVETFKQSENEQDRGRRNCPCLPDHPSRLLEQAAWHEGTDLCAVGLGFTRGRWVTAAVGARKADRRRRRVDRWRVRCSARTRPSASKISAHLTTITRSPSEAVGLWAIEQSIDQGIRDLLDSRRCCRARMRSRQPRTPAGTGRNGVARPLPA